MKHFSNIVKDGAVRLGLTGTFAADTVGFQNPDGSYAFVLFNPFTRVLPVELKVEGETRLFSLPPQSINSIVIEGEEIKQTERKAD
jgi:O-glycosyl hydrolase